MDPAPQQNSSPTMPDPARVVSKSVAMLTRQGADQFSALAMVMSVATQCDQLMALACLYDLGWFSAIREEASRRLRGLTPPSEHMEANPNGGETSPGRTAAAG